MTKRPLHPRNAAWSLGVVILLAGFTLAASVQKRAATVVSPGVTSSISQNPATAPSTIIQPPSVKPAPSPAKSTQVTQNTRPTINVLSTTGGVYRFEFSYPEPTVETTKGISSITIEGLQMNRIETGYMLPFDVRPFVWTSGNPTVRTIAIETGRKPAPGLTKTPLTFGDSIIAQPAADRAGYQPSQYLTTRSSGKYRGIPLAAFTIYPVRYNAASGEIQYIKRLVVEVSGGRATAAPTGRATTNTEREQLRRLTGPLSVTMPANLRIDLPAITASFDNDNTPHVRIDVTKWGINRITGRQLQRIGVPISTLDPRNLLMVSERQVVPIHVEGDGDGHLDPDDVIEFFGRPPLPEDSARAPDLTGNRYTNEKAYILSWSGRTGVRIPEISGQIQSTDLREFCTVNSGPTHMHFEVNDYFAAMNEVDDEMRDRWFWDTGIYKYQIVQYRYYLPYPDSLSYSPIKIRVALHSLTGSGAKHHAFILLNGLSDYALEVGRQVYLVRGGDSTVYDWVGQQLRIVETTSARNLNNTNLHDGTNTLSIFSPGDTPGNEATNRIALNWFQVDYQRLPVAYNDELRIGTPNVGTYDTLFDFNLTNFTNPDIQLYRWGSAKIINGTVERYVQDTTRQIRYKIHFQDRPGVPTEYYAVTGNRKITVPDSMIAYIPADSLLDPPNGGAGYLVIGPQYLLQTRQLSNLLAIRAQQYNGAMAIDLEKVLTRFGQGMFHPAAIRSFLQYAVANWQIPPTTVMLLGDARYDQQFSPRRNGALIPHPMMPVGLVGAIGTDTWYSLLDDDYIPDLDIGRVSARTTSEAGEYFDKVLEVERLARHQRWQNTITFLRGDGGDVYGPGRPTLFDEFDHAHQLLLGPRYDFNNLQVTNADSFSYGGPPGIATQNLVTLFNRGTSLMIYNGHGAGAIWGDFGLFRTSDIDLLSNQEKYPLICNFSCYIVTFNLPLQRVTMGEEFIFSPRRGATGVFGATGLGILQQGLIFQSGMFRDFAEHPGISYGQLISDSKAIYAISNGGAITLGVSNEYWATTLLGDPGIRFPAFNDVPQDNSESLVNNGDVITVSSTLPFNSGTASFRWYRSNYTTVDNPAWFPRDTVFTVTSNQFSARLRIPNINTPSATIRGFYQPVAGQATRATSTIYMRERLGGGILDSVLTDPSPLFADTTFRLAAKVVDPNGVRALKMTQRWLRYRTFEERDSTGHVIRTYDSLVTVRMDTAIGTPAPARGQYWFETMPFRADSENSNLSVKVLWTDSLGRASVSDSFTYVAIYEKPNLEWNSRFVWGLHDSVTAIMQLYNNGHIPCDSSRARYTVWQGSDTLGVFYRTIPPIANGKYVTVVWSFPFPPGLYFMRVDADIDHVISEQDETDNTYFFNVINEYWLTSASNGSVTGWHTPERNIRFTIPSGSINKPSTVIRSVTIDTLSVLDQQGYQFATFRGSSRVGRGFTLTMIDSNVTLSRVIVEFTTDTFYTDTNRMNNIEVHGRSVNGLWHKLPSTRNAGGVYRYDGPPYSAFALINNEDFTGPTFRFAAEGQIFSDGGYIRRGARFSAMAFDGGGLDLSIPGAVIAVVDGDTLTSDEMMLPVGISNGKTQSVSINHQFTAGTHTASLTLSDIAGNDSIKVIHFVVVNDFRLDWIGNFPNPFSRTTTFFYNLTDQTTEPIEIAIYTVAGRKIRTLRETEAKVINYRELTWDGRDDEGETVANGVYFYRFIAKNGLKTIEHKGKMAKLR